MKGLIRWNGTKYELVSKQDTKKVLVRSNNIGYLNYLVVQKKHSKVNAAGITEVEVISKNPNDDKVVSVGAPTVTAAVPVSIKPQFTLDEKFELMADLIDMVAVTKSAKSMIISGRGGVGKTYTLLQRLRLAGLIDVATVMPSFADLDKTAIVVEDTEEEMEEKILAEIGRPQGDYVVIKGYSTPKALYRALFENRKRLIIFDDCDKVLQNETCVGLLKPALDSYEERYVSWRTEQAFGESDLPQSFKFEGRIIFITNMELGKVDEAVRTRCFKVDVSMNTEQRLQRMRNVLPEVMPEVDLSLKLDALKVLEENKNLTDDINFRSLMNTITIRLEDKPNWKKLAKFSLLEQ